MKILDEQRKFIGKKSVKLCQNVFNCVNERNKCLTISVITVKKHKLNKIPPMKKNFTNGKMIYVRIR